MLLLLLPKKYSLVALLEALFARDRGYLCVLHLKATVHTARSKV